MNVSANFDSANFDSLTLELPNLESPNLESHGSAVEPHGSGVPTATIALGQMLRPQIVGGKVAMPVQDYNVYTRFKHIAVTPASANSVGYSSTRLRILDTLIDRLVQMKKHSVQREEKQISSGMSSEAIDALIRQYAGKYQNLQNSGVNALSQERGMNFGHSESENALFLDMLA